MLPADTGPSPQNVVECRAELNDDVYQQIDRCLRTVPHVAIAVLAVRKKLEERQATQQIRFSKSSREAADALRDAVSALEANHPKAAVHTAIEIRRDVRSEVYLALYPSPLPAAVTIAAPFSKQETSTRPHLGIVFGAGIGVARISARTFRMAEASLTLPLDNGFTIGLIGRAHLSDAKRDLYTSYMTAGYRTAAGGVGVGLDALAGAASLETGDFAYDLGARALFKLPLEVAAPFLALGWTMRAPSASIGIEVTL